MLNFSNEVAASFGVIILSFMTICYLFFQVDKFHKRNRFKKRQDPLAELDQLELKDRIVVGVLIASQICLLILAVIFHEPKEADQRLEGVKAVLKDNLKMQVTKETKNIIYLKDPRNSYGVMVKITSLEYQDDEAPQESLAEEAH